MPADKCGLCGAIKEIELKTLYGVLICSRCHELLMAHDLKEDIEDLEKQISNLNESLEHCAPGRVRMQPKYYYFRETFRTLKIPRPVYEFNVEPLSPTCEALKQRSFLDKVISSIFPKLWGQWFLDCEVQKKIEIELSQSKKDIELKKQTQINANLEALRDKSSKYVERGIEKIYPERYQRIIRKARNEKILLYEYFLGEYPPDWDFRAQEVRRRDGSKCQNCGAHGVELHVHHKRPVVCFNYGSIRVRRSPLKWTELQRRGKGTHSMDNLTTLCRKCHSVKHPHMRAR